MGAGKAMSFATVDVGLEPDTGLTHRVHGHGEKRPWVSLKVGTYPAEVVFYIYDLATLDALADAVEAARQDLAQALGLLPSGEPCAYADVFGSIEWNEHDHDACLEHLVDEPVPLRPTLGTVA